jgi:hypothetical protein
MALIKPTLTAVAAFFAGSLAWARLLRVPYAALPLLFGELAILLAVLGAWLAVDAHPNGVLTLVLLALAAIAMGGQSTLGAAHPSDHYLFHRAGDQGCWHGGGRLDQSAEHWHPSARRPAGWSSRVRRRPV